ncbi:MAG TPA: (2Fe-2S)-binding protein [Acidobacteriaceae bacterium]|jgi:sarcosine oxidase subunit alpha
MPDLLTILVNGSELRVKPGTVVSAALLTAGIPCRRSITGEPRTALCGMGICFECRATVDGVPHQRTCQLLCRPGMVIETQ